MGQVSANKKWNKLFKALNYQAEGNTFTDLSDNQIYDMFEYQKFDSLRTALKKVDFEYNKELGVFTPLTEKARELMNNREYQEQLTPEPKSKSNNKDIENVIINVIKHHITEIRELINEEEPNTSNINELQIPQNRDKETVQASYNVYIETKDKFKEFCKEYKNEYKGYELVSQALEEFMEKYSK